MAGPIIRGTNLQFFLTRAEQARAWMWNEVGETLLTDLRRHPGVRQIVPGLERDVEQGRATPAAAARRMLQAFHGR